MVKKRLFSFLKTFLPLALGLFFIVYSYNNFTPEDRQKLIQNITQVNPIWIALSIIGGLLSHLSRAYRWKLLLEPLGYKTRLSTNFMAVMGGYLANLGIPRSGEVLRGATVASYEDIPIDKVFGTIIIERAIDVLMLLAIVAIALLFHTDELFIFFDEYHINPWFSLIGLIVLISIGIIGLKFIKHSNWKIFVKIRGMASGVLQGIKSILQLKKKTAFIIHTLFIWSMYVFMFYILRNAFPAMESLSFGAMLAAFVAGSFAISITNGGIGIYPIAVGAVLALFGVHKNVGEAFGWVDWGAQTILNIVVGGLSLILLPILNKKKSK